MRRALRHFVLLTLCLGVAMLAPGRASAQTVIAAGTVYTSNVTWTANGSPYVVMGNLRVNAGAALTIQAGVVVKINGTLPLITINGQLVASGTSQSPVVITSIQDDAVDSGGDGSSTGQPGQWYGIRFDASGSYPSTLDYVDVRYGGFGSADNAYGALTVVSGTHAVTKSRIHHNHRSGIYVNGTAAEISVTKTRLDHNGNGVTANGGTASISNSVVDHNSSNGIYFNLPLAPPSQSVIFRSRIADNGVRGIWYNVVAAVPAAKAPVAHKSNIFRNGVLDQSGNWPVQLYVLQGASRTDVDWSDNYWGTWGAGSPVSANPCSAAGSSENPWHLAYGPYSEGSATVAPGPVTWKVKVISFVFPGTVCGSDLVDTYPHSTKPFETEYIGVLPFGAEYNIARDFRPFLKFDSNGRWTPLLLEPFFAELDGNEGAHKFCPTAGGCDDGIALTSLGQFRALAEGTPGGHLNINNNGSYSSSYVLSDECDPAWGSLRECGDPAHSAIYYNLTTVAGADGFATARSYWDYWWFYRYNDAHNAIVGRWDHEGDWEGMTVVTPAALDPEVGATDQILYFIYDQHGDGYRYLPGSYDAELGTHPVGYPADGSHATYADRCSTPGTFCIGPSNQPEGDHDGNHPWSINSSCASCIVPLPEANLSPTALPPQGADWNSILPRWGSTEDGVVNDANSPRAPGNQGRYVAPWNAGREPAPPPAFRRSASTRTRDTPTGVSSTCGDWFGGGVVVLMCDTRAARAADRVGLFGGRHKGTYTVRVANHDGARYGSTFGIAQVVGRPLVPGDTLVFKGDVPRGVTLKVRMADSAGRMLTATFRLPHLSGGLGKLDVSLLGRDRVALALSTGQRLRARQVVSTDLTRRGVGVCRVPRTR